MFPAIVKKNAGRSWLYALGTKINPNIHKNPPMNHIAAMMYIDDDAKMMNFRKAMEVN
jgi:hypothetical protein